MADPKSTLQQLHKNLSILEERRAKYGGSTPLELLNQIEDHKTAIALTEQRLADKLSEADWRKALKPLLLAVRAGQVVNIEAETYIAGEMQGDVVAGDKISGGVKLGDVEGGIHGSMIAGRDIIVQAPAQTTLPSPVMDAQDRRNLGILLDKVKSFWVEGVLEKSIHTEVMLELGKTKETEAVEHPWGRVLELPDQDSQSVPPDAPISALFDEMERAMLILGEPGSGKTITLLQLARELIEQWAVDDSFSQPLPVVFNLSSWTKGQKLMDWLVAELSAKYQIPKKIGQRWLTANYLLPLLDGLDEVRAEDRAACVEAINAFAEESGLAGLAVCSRLQEYTELPVRLKLNGAIRLQPLTLAQIDAHLSKLGSKLETLRNTLQADESLRELAQSPLMLNLMSLVYQDGSVQPDSALTTVEARRQHLFDAYVTRMFKRRGKAPQPFSPEQTRHWLSWLSGKMSQHNQTIFLMEQLQPSWTAARRWRWVYVFVSRLLVGLIGGLLAGQLFGLSFGLVFAETHGLWPGLQEGLLRGLVEGLFGGLLMGLIVAIIDVVWLEKSPASLAAISPARAWRRSVIKTFIVWLTIWLGVAVSYWLIFGSNRWLGFSRLFWLMEGFTVGLWFGLSGTLLFGTRAGRQSLTNDIQTVEQLNWSAPGALRGGGLGLAGGLLSGLLFALIEMWFGGVTPLSWLLYQTDLSVWGIFALIGGVTVGLLGIIFGGLSGSILQTRTIINQGIRLSLANAILAGIVGALFGGLILGLVGLLVGMQTSVDRTGLYFTAASYVPYGLFFGIIAALWYGGLNVVQHYTFRLMLWSGGRIPLFYTRFLDHCADLIFLRKVGGGYIFIHRLLLEHFATLGEVEAKAEVAEGREA